MSSRIKSHHLGLLADIINQGGSVPADQIDGRMLRPLRAENLVAVRNGIVKVTPLGRTTASSVSGPALVRAARTQGNEHAGLSEMQTDALRHLCRTGNPVLSDGIDGRVLRALRLRGFVDESDGWVSPTEAGRAYFEQFVRRRRRVHVGPEGASLSARAEVILRHVEALEAAIPTDAEVMVGDVAAYVDDILVGLRRFARDLSQTAERKTA